jgi:hypothetical protein
MKTLSNCGCNYFTFTGATFALSHRLRGINHRIRTPDALIEWHISLKAWRLVGTARLSAVSALAPGISYCVFAA